MIDVLEWLNTLISSTVDQTITINKASLSDIQTCLQNALDKIEFLQLELELQRDELQQKSCHSELVFV